MLPLLFITLNEMNKLVLCIIVLCSAGYYLLNAQADDIKGHELSNFHLDEYCDLCIENKNKKITVVHKKHELSNFHLDEYCDLCIEDKNKKITVAHKKEVPSDQKKSRSITGAYSQIIKIMSDKYRIEPSLIKAVIKVESNWNSKAVSNSGAIGLMQLMPKTAKYMNIRNPYDPEDNINGGAKYLRYLLDKFNGNLTHALAAYNAGPTRVKQYKGIPPIKETRQYVKRVLSAYNDEKSIYSAAQLLKSEI